MQFVVTRHPQTNNPMALVIRNQRAESHRVVPLRCQPWLAAGTILTGTMVNKNQSEWYVFHDIHQIGGRWLRDASHRERMGALVGFMRMVDTEGMGIEGWPKLSLATMLPKCDGKTEFAKTGVKEVGYSVRQVQRKVLSDKSVVYVSGTDSKPSSDRRIIMSTRQDNGQWSSTSSSRSGSGSSSPVSPTTNTPAVPTVTAPTKTNKPKAAKTQSKTNKRAEKRTETVIITAGNAGPDDYQGKDKVGNRIGPVFIRSLNLSLKLNQLLRGKHYDLYRPPGSMRVLREMSLPCVWEAKNQRWRPELEGIGTKAKTTYPVRTS